MSVEIILRKYYPNLLYSKIKKNDKCYTHNVYTIFGCSNEKYILKVKDTFKHIISKNNMQIIENLFHRDLIFANKIVGKCTSKYFHICDKEIYLEEYLNYNQKSKKELTEKDVENLGEMLSKIHGKLNKNIFLFRKVNRIKSIIEEDYLRCSNLLKDLKLNEKKGIDYYTRLNYNEIKNNILIYKNNISSITCNYNQVNHGDYYLPNIFFDKSKVCSVIDWDDLHLGNNIYELLRAINYIFVPDENGGLNQEHGKIFIAHYLKNSKIKYNNSLIIKGIEMFKIHRSIDSRLLYNKFVLEDSRSDIFLKQNYLFLKWLKNISVNDLIDMYFYEIID
ncbi:MAG: phosphotransferase [Candidatus Delongbacteria bacterium]|nr:phosphotransferase [Candidatus Delongbacteria bacterium]